MAVSFTAANSDYIDVAGNPAVLDIANNATMSLMCWINLAAIPTAGSPATIVGKGYDGTNTAYSFQIDTGGLAFGSFAVATTHGTVWTTSGWTTGAWHHIYGDYSGAGTHLWNIWGDGVFAVQTSDTTGPISTTKKFQIGAVDANGTPQQFFSGCIADVAIFNGQLTGTEILNLGTGLIRPPAVTSKTLLGYWAMDVAAATQPDTSAHNDGTAHSGAITTTCGNSPPYAAAAGALPPTFTQSPIPQVRNRILAY